MFAVWLRNQKYSEVNSGSSETFSSDSFRGPSILSLGFDKCEDGQGWLSHFIFGLLIPFFGSKDSMSSIRPMSIPSFSAVRMCCGAWIVSQNLICWPSQTIGKRNVIGLWVTAGRGFAVVLPGRLSWRRKAVPSRLLPVLARTSEGVVSLVGGRRRRLHNLIRLHRIAPCGPCGPKDPMSVPHLA